MFVMVVKLINGRLRFTTVCHLFCQYFCVVDLLS